MKRNWIEVLRQLALFALLFLLGRATGELVKCVYGGP